jgi:AraC-like DNA-binding protein/quercetin dioxygenase-like cupin family protein
MSKKRQSAIFEKSPDSRSEITTLTRDYPAGHHIPLHFHDRDQIVYASRGVMTVRTSIGAWVVPTHRAVWIPAKTPHTIAMSGNVAMRTLYLQPRLAAALPRDCCVLNVPPLLHELVLHACTFVALKRKIKSQRHLLDLLLDQLEIIQMVPLQLPNPADRRAWRIAETLLADPSDRRSLQNLCKGSGASKRTVERLFQDQAGMTFGRWRQQLRLMQALRLLAEGKQVTYAALEAGYSTPSAFIYMFRRILGTTPKLYFGSARKRMLSDQLLDSKREGEKR